MAVDDSVLLCADTDGLVTPNPNFYPVKVPVMHWQLRNFISAPENKIVYFASKADVYALDTSTHTRTHITVLPFDSRCFAANYGWACVAGGTGAEFVVIKLDEPNLSSTGAEVDSALPLELNIRPLPRPYTPRVKSERIGEQIINSVAIHKLYGPDGQEDVVAVLTNNDQTVRIYSLTNGAVTAKLDLPFATNHASISPDGNLLVAVGDYNQAYFYERTYNAPSAPAKDGTTNSISANSWWDLINVVQLVRPAGNRSTPAYFSTSWSHSGALCAVASEAGYITVLDTELVISSEWAEDAIVQIIPSTRPDREPGPGAIRAMCFSPPPWDLLVWTEDHGRACVADMRSGLRQRQVITLDPEAEAVQRINFDDSIGEISINEEVDRVRSYRRLFATEDGLRGSSSVMTDYLDILRERRRLDRLTEIVSRMTGDPAHGLGAEERQLLDTLRTTRQRIADQRSEANPRSINYSPTSHAQPRSPSPGPSFPTLTSATHPELQNQGLGEGVDTSGNSGSSPFPPLGSLREILQGRNRLQRERLESLARDDHHAPRRTSTVTANTDSSGSANTTNSSSSSGSSALEEAWATIQQAQSAPIVHTTSTIQHQQQQHQTNPTSPTSALSPPQTNSSPLSQQRQAQLARARQRLQEVRDLAPISVTNHIHSYVDMRREQLRQSGNPADGPRTTGLAMSEDGRMLFIGTEQGIWEFAVHWRERGMWAAKQVR